MVFDTAKYPQNILIYTNKMYKRHSIWDEDKLDIHSSGYAGGSSSGIGRGYAGHGSGSKEEYHKNEMYGSNKENDLPSGDYGSRDNKKDDPKKEDEGKERTIVDAVEQEEKYQKKEGSEEEFKSVAMGIQQISIENDSLTTKNSKNIKKKNTKNIEEAINEAIKEEKEIVHVD